MTRQHWCKELSFGAKSYLQLVVQKYLNSDGLSLKCASQKFFTTTILIIAILKAFKSNLGGVLLTIIRMMILIILMMRAKVTWVEYSSQRAANIARRLENVAASWTEKINY